MRVRYIGDGADTECVVFGHSFPEGEWVEVPASLRKLTTNPMFEVDTDGDGEPGPTAEELKADLDALGVEYHHRAGIPKLKALLEEATAPKAED